jgi:hypothetical protein
MPKGFLPFAALYGSDVLYLQDGQVFTWMSEGEGDEPNNCALIAKSFDDFLKLFHEGEDDE